MHAAQRFHYVLLLLLVAAPSVSVAGVRNSYVGVRNDVELQQALLDPGVRDQQLSWLHHGFTNNWLSLLRLMKGLLRQAVMPDEHAKHFHAVF
jgi:hypothetical protein